MKRYTNASRGLRCVSFEDGSAQFLMRGQSIETSKAVTKVQDGIRTKDVTRRAAKKAESEAPTDSADASVGEQETKE